MNNHGETVSIAEPLQNRQHTQNPQCCQREGLWKDEKGVRWDGKGERGEGRGKDEKGCGSRGQGERRRGEDGVNSLREVISHHLATLRSRSFRPHNSPPQIPLSKPAYRLHRFIVSHLMGAKLLKYCNFDQFLGDRL